MDEAGEEDGSRVDSGRQAAFVMLRRAVRMEEAFPRRPQPRDRDRAIEPDLWSMVDLWWV